MLKYAGSGAASACTSHCWARLRSLEREIQGKLFERRARGMIATPLGDIVIDGARLVLDELRRISDSLAQIEGKRTPARKTPPPTAKAEPDENRTGHVFTDLVLETFRLNGRLLAYGDGLVRPINLTSSRWQVLGSLPHNRATVSEIARYMGLQRQSVQRTIDVLCSEVWSVGRQSQSPPGQAGSADG